MALSTGDRNRYQQQHGKARSRLQMELAKCRVYGRNVAKMAVKWYSPDLPLTDLVGCEVLTAMMSSGMSCSLVKAYRSFGRICCLHLQGSRLSFVSFCLPCLHNFAVLLQKVFFFIYVIFLCRLKDGNKCFRGTRTCYLQSRIPDCTMSLPTKSKPAPSPKKKNPPWLWSASKLCRPSDRRFLAKYE
jgi:hypothetical protein